LVEATGNDAMFSIFVYGTLKRGGCHHDQYCRDAVRIKEASAFGTLHELAGEYYPALRLPAENIIAAGTADIRADMQVHQNISLSPEAFKRLGKDGDQVYGELITFDDPMLYVPPIDELEDFDGSDSSLYLRVLTPVKVRDTFLSAWTYHYNRPCPGRKIETGCWPQPRS
jgi:gamma-glutamylcyclotransferase (GGCT)/AIG2-like uncharacterized protein YtfP